MFRGEGLGRFRQRRWRHCIGRRGHQFAGEDHAGSNLLGTLDGSFAPRLTHQQIDLFDLEVFLVGFGFEAIVLVHSQGRTFYQGLDAGLRLLIPYRQGNSQSFALFSLGQPRDRSRCLAQTIQLEIFRLAQAHQHHLADGSITTDAGGGATTRFARKVRFVDQLFQRSVERLIQRCQVSG